MGSAAAAVEISSDEEDDEKMPASGKRKSPEDALGWAEKMLCEEDGDAAGVVLEDLQEFLNSLMDETGIVLGGKEESDVGGKNGVGGAGEDDDDCVILDSDPEKAVAVAKEGHPRDDGEDELQIVAEKGELACRDFPHPRHLCASLPFISTSHARHCSMCHCYVCDSPAPCAFWGKGNVRTDHCHATDKDAKWKKLRQTSKNKNQQTPKRRNIQSYIHSSATEPFSQSSSNVAMHSTRRYSVLNIMSPNPQVVLQNTGQGIRAPSSIPSTTIPSYRPKSTPVTPPACIPSNVNRIGTSHTSYGPMQSAQPRAFRTAQVSPGGRSSAGTFQNYPSLLGVGASIGSQGHQYQPPSYPQVPPNTVVGSGVPLTQRTSLATQVAQHPQVPSADTNVTLKEALDRLALKMGVPDYNINQPFGQQSAGTPQSLHPTQLLAQAAQSKTSQWANVKKSYVVATPQMGPSSTHNSSNRASGGVVASPGAVEIKQPFCQLNSQTNLSPSTLYLPQP